MTTKHRPTGSSSKRTSVVSVSSLPSTIMNNTNYANSAIDENEDGYDNTELSVVQLKISMGLEKYSKRNIKGLFLNVVNSKSCESYIKISSKRILDCFAVPEKDYNMILENYLKSIKPYYDSKQMNKFKNDFSVTLKNKNPGNNIKLCLDVDCLKCKDKNNFNITDKTKHISSSKVLPVVLNTIYENTNIKSNDVYVTKGNTCGLHVFVNDVYVNRYNFDRIINSINIEFEKKRVVVGKYVLVDNCPNIPFPLSLGHTNVNKCVVDWKSHDASSSKQLKVVFSNVSSINFDILCKISNFYKVDNDKNLIFKKPISMENEETMDVDNTNLFNNTSSNKSSTDCFRKQKSKSIILQSNSGNLKKMHSKKRSKSVLNINTDVGDDINLSNTVGKYDRKIRKSKSSIAKCDKENEDDGGGGYDSFSGNADDILLYDENKEKVSVDRNKKRKKMCIIDDDECDGNSSNIGSLISNSGSSVKKRKRVFQIEDDNDDEIMDQRSKTNNNTSSDDKDNHSYIKNKNISLNIENTLIEMEIGEEKSLPGKESVQQKSFSSSSDTNDRTESEERNEDNGNEVFDNERMQNKTKNSCVSGYNNVSEFNSSISTDGGRISGKESSRCHITRYVSKQISPQGYEETLFDDKHEKQILVSDMSNYLMKESLVDTLPLLKQQQQQQKQHREPFNYYNNDDNSENKKISCTDLSSCNLHLKNTSRGSDNNVGADCDSSICVGGSCINSNCNLNEKENDNMVYNDSIVTNNNTLYNESILTNNFDNASINKFKMSMDNRSIVSQQITNRKKINNDSAIYNESILTNNSGINNVYNESILTNNCDNNSNTFMSIAKHFSNLKNNNDNEDEYIGNEKFEEYFKNKEIGEHEEDGEKEYGEDEDNSNNGSKLFNLKYDSSRKYSKKSNMSTCMKKSFELNDKINNNIITLEYLDENYNDEICENPDSQFILKKLRDEIKLSNKINKSNNIQFKNGNSLMIDRHYKLHLFSENIPRILYKGDCLDEVTWVKLKCKYFDNHMNNPFFLNIYFKVILDIKGSKDIYYADINELNTLLNNIKYFLEQYKCKKKFFKKPNLDQFSIDVKKNRCVSGLIKFCSFNCNIITGIFTDLLKTQQNDPVGEEYDNLNATVLWYKNGDNRNGNINLDEDNIDFDDSASQIDNSKKRKLVDNDDDYDNDEDKDEEEEEEEINNVKDCANNKDSNKNKIVNNYYVILSSIINYEYDNLNSTTKTSMFCYYNNTDIDSLNIITDEILFDGIMITGLLHFSIVKAKNNDSIESVFSSLCESSQNIYKFENKSSNANGGEVKKKSTKKKKINENDLFIDDSSETDNTTNNNYEDENESKEYNCIMSQFYDLMINYYFRPVVYYEKAQVYCGKNGFKLSVEEATNIGYKLINDKGTSLLAAFKSRQFKYSMKHGCLLMYNTDMFDNKLKMTYSANLVLNVYEMTFGGCTTQMERQLKNLLYDKSRFNLELYHIISEAKTACSDMNISIDLSYMNLLLKQPVVPPIFENDEKVRQLFLSNKSIEKGGFSCLNYIDYIRMVNMYDNNGNDIYRHYIGTDENRIKVHTNVFNFLNSLINGNNEIEYDTFPSDSTMKNTKTKNNFNLIKYDVNSEKGFRSLLLFFTTFQYEVLFKIWYTLFSEDRRDISLGILTVELDLHNIMTLFFGDEEFKCIPGLSEDILELLNISRKQSNNRNGFNFDDEYTDASPPIVNNVHKDLKTKLHRKNERMKELFSKSCSIEIMRSYNLISNDDEDGQDGDEYDDDDEEECVKRKISGDNNDDDTNDNVENNLILDENGDRINDDDNNNYGPLLKNKNKMNELIDGHVNNFVENCQADDNNNYDNTAYYKLKHLFTMNNNDLDKYIYESDDWYEILENRLLASSMDNNSWKCNPSKQITSDTMMSFMKCELKSNINHNRLGKIIQCVNSGKSFKILNNLPMKIKLFGIILATHTMKRLPKTFAEEFVKSEYNDLILNNDCDLLFNNQINDNFKDVSSSASSSSSRRKNNNKEPHIIWKTNIQNILQNRYSNLEYLQYLGDRNYPENYFIAVNKDGKNAKTYYTILYDFMCKNKNEYPIFKRNMPNKKQNNNFIDTNVIRNICIAMMYVMVMSAYDMEHVELYLKTFLSFEYPGQWSKSIFVWKSNTNGGKSYLFDSVLKKAFGTATCINDPKSSNKDTAPEKTDYYKHFILYNNEFSISASNELKRLVSDSTYKFRLNFGNEMKEAFTLGKLLFNCNVLPSTNDAAASNRILLFNMPFWFSEVNQVADAMFNWISSTQKMGEFEIKCRRNIVSMFKEEEKECFSKLFHKDTSIFEKDKAINYITHRSESNSKRSASMFLIQNKCAMIYMAVTPPSESIAKGAINICKYFSLPRYFEELSKPVNFSHIPATSIQLKTEWERCTQPYYDWKKNTCIREDMTQRTKSSIIYESLKSVKNSSFFELKQFFETDFYNSRDPVNDEYFVWLKP